MKELCKLLVCVLISGLVVLGVLEGRKALDVSEARVGLYRTTVLSYLVDPDFGVKDFMRQTLGVDGEMEMYNVDEGKLYFSFPEEKYGAETLARFTEHPRFVEFGQPEGDVLALGDYRLRKPGHYFFRFPAEHLRVVPDVRVRVKFSKVAYSATLGELTAFLQDEVLYPGKVQFYTGECSSLGGRVRMWNLGTQVAKPSEPSLSRLARDILAVDPSRATTAQKLLDFVSREIPYNHDELLWGGQVMKRPSEVLLSKAAICAGKATLYASLLEQVGVRYKLLYYPNHLTVFVEGRYDNHNGCGLRIGEREFHLAEPTAPGFQIGRSVLVKPFDWVRDAKAVQDPPAGTLTERYLGTPVRWVKDDI